MRALLLTLFLVLGAAATAQKYTRSHIFAHNDYVRDSAFWTAYRLGVGYIEADVFLQDGDLMVAHHRDEIVAGRNLKRLYLEPLQSEVQKRGGLIYAQTDRFLTLMIDLKTEGAATMKTLMDQLKGYPLLTSSANLRFMISGNVPPAETWKDYPPYISFDGRPGIWYTPDQLDRISMISIGFPSQVKWDGKTALSSGQIGKIDSLQSYAHRLGKKFRFWATPDFEHAWKQLMLLNMDVIVTDDVEGLVRFVERNSP